jgi:hypothetical protein
MLLQVQYDALRTRRTTAESVTFTGRQSRALIVETATNKVDSRMLLSIPSSFGNKAIRKY